MKTKKKRERARKKPADPCSFKKNVPKYLSPVNNTVKLWFSSTLQTMRLMHMNDQKGKEKSSSLAAVSSGIKGNKSRVRKKAPEEQF